MKIARGKMSRTMRQEAAFKVLKRILETKKAKICKKEELDPDKFYVQMDVGTAPELGVDGTSVNVGPFPDEAAAQSAVDAAGGAISAGSCAGAGGDLPPADMGAPMPGEEDDLMKTGAGIGMESIRERVLKRILEAEAKMSANTTAGSGTSAECGGSGNLATGNPPIATQSAGDIGAEHKLPVKSTDAPTFGGSKNVESAPAAGGLVSNGGDLGTVAKSAELQSNGGDLGTGQAKTIQSNGGDLGSVSEGRVDERTGSGIFPGNYVAVREKNTAKQIDRGIVMKSDKMRFWLEGNVEYSLNDVDVLRLA